MVLCLCLEKLLSTKSLVHAQEQLTALPVVKLVMPFHPYLAKTGLVTGAVY